MTYKNYKAVKGEVYPQEIHFISTLHCIVNVTHHEM